MKDISYEHAVVQTSGLDFVVLDLDRVASPDWSRVLKELIQLSRSGGTLEGILLVYDPALHDSKIAELIKQLGKSARISVFTKPINLLELFQRMNFELALSR